MVGCAEDRADGNGAGDALRVALVASAVAAFVAAPAFAGGVLLADCDSLFAAPAGGFTAGADVLTAADAGGGAGGAGAAGGSLGLRVSVDAAGGGSGCADAGVVFGASAGG